MKKSFLFFVFIILLGGVHAQGNLQFNQVLNLDALPTGSTYTIPSGKVWKIESVALSANNAYFQIQYSGTNYYVLNNSVPFSNLPYWLPSAISVTFVGSSSAKVSIIEFNVVP
jgi:hypothetical protein